MKNDLLATLAFGIALVVLGAILLRWHCRVWHEHRREGVLKEREFQYYCSQFRRRAQVSLLLMLLGVALPVGDALMTFGRLDKGAAAWWIAGMLLVALWIMLLAALDWMVTRLHQRAARASLASLSRRRRELEREAARLRQLRGNGHGQSPFPQGEETGKT